MRIKESAENYLEAIFVLKSKHGSVRSIDIANHLSFTKPSVSVAMKALRENGYITVDKEGNISLTDDGQKIAKGVFEKHEIIATALIELGVSPETAYEDSCKIEHDLSDESFNKIRDFLLRHKERTGVE